MERDREDSLDLGHLTEHEQEAILQVLLRDSELRRRDEGRVRSLQETEVNPVRLRTLSGSWFSEERSKRHRSAKPGADLVHSSIRRRKSKGKEVPLADLFDGLGKEPPPGALCSLTPGVEQRLGEDQEEQRDDQHQERITPAPAPRTKARQTQNVQSKDEPSLSTEFENTTSDRPPSPEVKGSDDASLSSGSEHRSNSHSPTAEEVKEKDGVSLSSESEHRSNSHVATTEEDSEGHNGDTDSLSSGHTDPVSASLRTTGSVSSLYSSYTIGGSMMSLFSSGEFGAVEVRGRLQFSLVYHTQREELLVSVCRCEDLATARKNRSDPYVKAYLLPDKSSHSKKKTKVKKNTQSPVYDQTLKYKVPVGELRGRTLNLSVWHAEALGRNIFLGEVEVLLASWDWACSQPQWHPLQPRVQLSPDDISSRGIIVFSVKFIPQGSEGGGLPLTGELHIWLREAQGLLSIKGGAVDSFVKSYILPDAGRQSGQKTRTVKHSISPAYNHTMVYDGFHTSDLREACAELTVWQRDGLKTRPLGGVRLSPGTGQSYGEDVVWMDSTKEERAVWDAMMENPHKWIDASLPIRTNILLQNN
ncbi:synaptotagmin-like protein 1 isoform X1 [Gadus macrocephalus]|uniref:synaptotagmin-like protein 1 isoform X1 n=1 Tax=Gadus macrocephalus TaxID=80720 RepID=UPI0028CB806B|nr:synaptotagmin-like protein 1 isoform X1 [Gadus macrocephalus]